MAIKCCNGCVAPKRFPGCHGSCPEYLSEKAAYEERKVKEDKIRYTRQGLYEQRSRVVHRAMKNSFTKKKKEGQQ